MAQIFNELKSHPFRSGNTPTYGKSDATLQSEGWITLESVLAPEHDAARVHWGGKWRMPTNKELQDLSDKCTWDRTRKNGVKGYDVRGKGAYASASIFLPCAGYVSGTSFKNTGTGGRYLSSTYSGYNDTWDLFFDFDLNRYGLNGSLECYCGRSVRPVQEFNN